MSCPVVRAIAEIRGGASEEQRNGVVLGSGENAAVHHGGDPTFRATACKLELARAKLGESRGADATVNGGRPSYRGDLLRFVGNSKHFALCYLLGAGSDALRQRLADLDRVAREHDPYAQSYCALVPEICFMYPNVLRDAINGAIDDLGIMGVEYLPPLDFDKNVYRGVFPRTATPENLELIANSLMEIAKTADAMSFYHLVAAQKIDEIMRAKH